MSARQNYLKWYIDFTDSKRLGTIARSLFLRCDEMARDFSFVYVEVVTGAGMNYPLRLDS